MMKILVYVEASENCNDLIFEMGSQAIDASVTSRQWAIKV